MGRHVMRGGMSCGKACHVGRHVMWGDMSCGDACHVGMHVMCIEMYKVVVSVQSELL